MFVEIPPHIAVSLLRAGRQGTVVASGADGIPGLAQALLGGVSGLGATSPPRAATSRTLSYFSIFSTTNLPATAGSYSLVERGIMLSYSY